MLDDPTAADFLAAFKGRVYGAVGPALVRRNLRSGPGWGGSGQDVESLRLSFLVGRERTEVVIETGVRSRTVLVDVQLLIVNLLLSSVSHRRPLRRFPIDLRIDRRTLTLPVDGEELKFTAYSCDPVMHAVGKLGDLAITLHGPADLVPRLRLATLSPRAVSRWLSPESRDRDRRRPEP